MSHSNFVFLMALEFDALTDIEEDEERLGFISDYFSDAFESRLDENNWFKHRMVFFKDGSFLAWPDQDLGRFANVPKDMRWNEVRRFALQCVAVDFRLFGAEPYSFAAIDRNKRIESATVEELITEICRQIPKTLSQQYHLLQGKIPTHGALQDNSWTEEFRRIRTVMMYEAFRYSIHVPFTTWNAVFPYEYRAFDITSLRDPNAILITNIHT